MYKERTFTNAPWEKKIGYCRALKAGNHIYVTGTGSLDKDGKTFAPGRPYEQTKKCLEIIEDALQELGTDLSCITRTRMFITDINKWEEYGKAHAEYFGKYPPTTSMIEIKRLITQDMMIEIEADGVVFDH